MFSDEISYEDRLWEHYKYHFGSKCTVCRIDDPVIQDIDPNIVILRFEPNSENHYYVYCTIGMSRYDDEKPVEMMIYAGESHYANIVMLAQLIVKNRTIAQVKTEDIFELDMSTAPQFTCTCGLIELPCHEEKSFAVTEHGVNCLWLIPITKEEFDYQKKYGYDALQQKFMSNFFDILNHKRKSLV